jgi:septal ring factor EnvC (AmiA/AmiB activator)
MIQDVDELDLITSHTYEHAEKKAKKAAKKAAKAAKEAEEEAKKKTGPNFKISKSRRRLSGRSNLLSHSDRSSPAWPLNLRRD